MFKGFADKLQLPLTTDAQIDFAMERFFEVLYRDEESNYLGQCVLYGWCWVHGLPTRNASVLPLSRQSLRGWRSLEPTGSKDPCPWEVALLLAKWFIDQKLVIMAAWIVITFDCYLRPSEGLQLKRCNILRPAVAVSPAYRHWSLVVCPSEDTKVTKTGSRDDSLVVGIAERKWVAKVVENLWRRRKEGEPLFPLTLAQVGAHLREATSDLEIKALNITAHSMRHGGPSNDVYRGNLSLYEVRRRGRWRAEASVARYEKHARLQLQLNRLSTDQQRLAQQASRTVEAALLAAKF